VKRDGHPAESLRGAILTFATHPGEHVRLEK
jgi:hypothetical protein